MSDLPKMPMPARTLYGPNRTVDGHYFTADQMRAYAQAALNARTGGDGWLPIESAPKDGTLVLLSRPGAAVWQGNWVGQSGRYVINGWTRFNSVDIGWEPTHWQPLPTPPAALASQAVGVKS